MKKIVAIAAGLLLAGQSTLAVAATDDAGVSKAPSAHVREVGQCNLQQRKLAKADQTRVRAANRCNLAEEGGIKDVGPLYWALPIVVVGVGVGIYEATKSTSP